MKKIVYLLNTTYSLGGSSKSFLSMLQGVMRNGVSPIVVVPDSGGICQELAALGVQVLVVPYRPATYPANRTWRDCMLFFPRLVARRLLNAFAVKRLKNMVKHEGVELVHTNVSVIDVGFRLSRSLNVPHVMHVREYANLDFGESYYPTWKCFHRRLRTLGSYMICITRDIQRHHGFNTSSSRVIYNGICSMESDFGSVGGRYFLYAGRIEPAKGLLQLLEAYSRYVKLNEEAYPLWIAGEASDAAYDAEVRHYVTAWKLSERVHFLGARRDIVRLMRQAKALVVPSRFEAFGRCMAEAMFNGCLVIGHDTGGTKEQFDNGLRLSGKEIGFRYRTIDELTECLEKVSALSPDEEAALLQRAGDVVNRLYSVDAYVNSILNLYEEIANERCY